MISVPIRSWIHLQQKYSTRILLLLVILLAAALRFYGLEKQSLWNDEFFTLWSISFESLKNVLGKGVIPDTHPPVFPIVIFWMVKLFGNSEAVLRIPSAVSGVFAVLGTFLVGKELFSDKEGLLGSAIMAVSWTPVFFSQEARNGMMMVFTTVFATYYWLRILTKVHLGEPVHFLLSLVYIFFAILSCYVHYFSLAFILFQGLISCMFFYRYWEKLKIILILYGMIFVAYFPWLPFFYFQFTHSQNRIDWIPVPGIKELISFWNFVYGGDFSPHFSNSSLVVIQAFIPVLILFYLLSGKRFINSRNKLPVSSDTLLILLFILPVFITYIVSQVFKPLFVDKYLLLVFPAGYILLACSILSLPIYPWIRNSVSFLLLGFLLFELIFPLGYYSRVLKEPFRMVAEYITQSHRNNSKVITNNMVPDMLNYYFTRIGSENKEDLRFSGFETEGLPFKEINGLIENQDTDYILYIKQRLNQNSDELLLKYLIHSLAQVEHEIMVDEYWRLGFDIYLFKVSKPY